MRQEKNASVSPFIFSIAIRLINARGHTGFNTNCRSSQGFQVNKPGHHHPFTPLIVMMKLPKRTSLFCCRYTGHHAAHADLFRSGTTADSMTERTASTVPAAIVIRNPARNVAGSRSMNATIPPAASAVANVKIAA